MSQLPASSAGFALETVPATRAVAVAAFGNHRRLAVRQRRRWLELLFNWEAKNSYAVYDEDGQHALQVKENGSGLMNILKRLFLRTMRPFSSTVYENPIPRPLIHLHRPFRFFFATLEVTAADGTVIGRIEREWSLIKRIYRVENPQGVEVARIVGPFFRPWTFEIKVGDVVVGMVQKRWGGMVRELLTDADNFAVEMEKITDPELRILAFASTVLIDVVHFEMARRN